MTGKLLRRWCGGCAVVLLATAAAALAAATVSAEPSVTRLHAAAPPLQALMPASFDDTTLVPSRARSALVTWIGGPTPAATGETVTVYLSTSLRPELGTPQSWADTFAGLVHGSELSTLTAYVATLEEIQDICGDFYALGCYGGGLLYTVGEPTPWADPIEIATHEYGHHVALKRDNTPWPAIDWGTKRWASLENVCTLASAGVIFPGDEDTRYRLNPGEGFAEVYRVLNETRRGATSFSWQIVDGSFMPDQAALQAAEQDVLQPWTASSPTTIRAKFTEKGKKTWTLSVATPLDGVLTATLSLPATRPYTLSLLTTDGKTLATGLWSGARTQTLKFTVCGQRSVVIRVSRGGPAGTFSLALAKP